MECFIYVLVLARSYYDLQAFKLENIFNKLSGEQWCCLKTDWFFRKNTKAEFEKIITIVIKKDIKVGNK